MLEPSWSNPVFVGLVCSGALAVMYALNHKLAPRSDAEALSTMLVFLWLAETALAFVPRPPDPDWLLSSLDLIGGMGAVICWRRRAMWWKEALAATFATAIMIQLVHGLMFWWKPETNTREFRNMFHLARNVLFFAQVAFTGWTGGVRAANRSRQWLLDLTSRHRLVDSSR